MVLQNYNPTSPGRRTLVSVSREGLWKGRPEKTLTEGLSSKGGRNNNGRITTRRRGGGHKKRYRKVDFKRSRWDISATVQRKEYDTKRSQFLKS